MKNIGGSMNNQILKELRFGIYIKYLNKSKVILKRRNSNFKMYQLFLYSVSTLIPQCINFSYTVSQ